MARIFTTFIIIILLITTVVGFTGAGFLYFERTTDRQSIIDLEVTNQQLESDVTELTEQVSDLQALVDGNTSSTEMLDCYTASSDGWLVVNTPCQGQELTESIQLEGVAFGFFENNIAYELLDGNTVVDEGFLTYSAPDLGVPGILDETIELNIPQTLTTINPTLVLYGESAMDGSRIHVVEIELSN